MQELLTPESLALMAAFFGATVVLQWTPAGWAADILIAGVTGVGLIMLGREGITVVQELMAFYDKAVNATSKEDLEESGRHLATAVSKTSVDIVLGMLLHRVGGAMGPETPPPAGARSMLVTREGSTELSTIVRSGPPALPEGGGSTARIGTRLTLRAVDVEGGVVFMDMEGNIHARIATDGTVEFWSETLAMDVARRGYLDAMLAWLRGAPAEPAAPAEAAITSASSRLALTDRAAGAEPAARAAPEPAGGPGAGAGQSAGQAGASAESGPAPGVSPGGAGRPIRLDEAGVRTISDTDALVDEMLKAIDVPQLPVLASSPGTGPAAAAGAGASPAPVLAAAPAASVAAPGAAPPGGSPGAALAAGLAAHATAATITGLAPAPVRPRHLEDLVDDDGAFLPAYTYLITAYAAYTTRVQARSREPMSALDWALRQVQGHVADYLNSVMAPGWREQRRGRYPGYRPELIDRPSASPVPGTVAPDGTVWTERLVSIDELIAGVDEAGDPYWTFPDLVDGQVLILPSGTRVWREPGSREVMEEHPVGPSVSSRRADTAGEEVMLPGFEVNQEDTHRLHGAASPGLGFDSPYSIARGSREINLSIENSGIELWVRRLRDNSPDGIQYVFTTGTQRTSRGDLVSRTYTVSVIDENQPGELTELLTLGVDAGDPPEVRLQSVSAEAMLQYGTPLLREQPPGQTTARVDIPPGLRTYLGFTARPAIESLPAEVTDAIDSGQAAREALDRIYRNQAMLGRTDDLDLIDEVVADLQRAEDWLATASPYDPGVAELGAAMDNLAAALSGRRTQLDLGAINEFRIRVADALS
jgi:hypothetical protein